MNGDVRLPAGRQGDWEARRVSSFQVFLTGRRATSNVGRERKGYHSAPMRTLTVTSPKIFWWRGKDLNLRPSGYESSPRLLWGLFESARVGLNDGSTWTFFAAPREGRHDQLAARETKVGQK